MSSSRAKKLRDQNVVVTLVKDLTKKMSDFEESVSELKILKDSILELNDEVTRQESENAAILSRLSNDLKENKLKILNDAASLAGKILISKEELSELKNDNEKLKKDFVNFKTESENVIKQKVEEQVETRLKVQQLQFECQTAQLTAANENFLKQVGDLNETIKRMSAELDSQKKLTADVARVQRPVESVRKE
jgi:chromosome segregation ATPase